MCAALYTMTIDSLIIKDFLTIFYKKFFDFLLIFFDFIIFIRIMDKNFLGRPIIGSPFQHIFF